MRISQDGRKTLILGVSRAIPSDEEMSRFLAGLRDDPNAEGKLNEGFLRVTEAIFRHFATAKMAEICQNGGGNPSELHS